MTEVLKRWSKENAGEEINGTTQKKWAEPPD